MSKIKVNVNENAIDNEYYKIYKIIMKDGGIVEQKTDDRDFFIDSLKYYEKFGMEILCKDYDLLEEGSIVTEYEKKWRDRNKSIYYVKAKFR